MTAQLKIPAVYMRGGTSKGVFFRADALPERREEWDPILLRVVGSPDPYGQQIDGMGGATSSTSKVVVIAKSSHDDCDVDYLFGAVSIADPVIDWSGNCGNLTAAVAPFALSEGLAAGVRDGVAVVRIWQANIGKRIVAHVPMKDGEVQEDGDFELDGVTFPAAEIRLEFLDLAGAASGDTADATFPTGNKTDRLVIPDVGEFEVTYINGGNPAIFLDARAIGMRGNERQSDVNGDVKFLALCETIRSHGAVAMGLAATPADATRNRPHTPKLAFFAEPLDYVSSNGKPVARQDFDLSARILSMGKLHHAMTGTGAVAIAVAAAIPGTVVNRIAGKRQATQVKFGHPSGTLTVGAEATEVAGQWIVTKAVMSRSARRLMEGWVRVPQLT